MKNIMRLQRLRVFPNMVALFETTLIHLASTLQSRAEKMKSQNHLLYLDCDFWICRETQSKFILSIVSSTLHCVQTKASNPKKSESFFCYGSLFSVGPYLSAATLTFPPPSVHGNQSPRRKNFLMETMLKSFQHNGFSGKFLWWEVIKRSLIILNSIGG